MKNIHIDDQDQTIYESDDDFSHASPNGMHDYFK